MAGSPIGTIIYVTEFGSCPPSLNWDYAFPFSERELPTLTEPGYKHVGWYTSPTFEEDTKVKPGDPTIQNGYPIERLYAKWVREPKVYSINGQLLEDIANSIRKVVNKTEKLTLSEMEKELREIPKAEGIEF